jgi:hypothetical protein
MVMVSYPVDAFFGSPAFAAGLKLGLEGLGDSGLELGAKLRDDALGAGG